MKIEVKKETTEQIDIELPSFRKFSNTYMYKIVDEKTVIGVLNDSIYKSNIQAALDRTTECSESEFNELYSKTMEYLSELTFNTQTVC